MNSAPVLPVARLDSTSVLPSSTAAYTVELLSELIAFANSLALSPALTVKLLPSIVSVSSAAGLVNVKVRWAELASCVTSTS